LTGTAANDCSKPLAAQVCSVTLGAHLLQASSQRFMKPRIGGGNAWPGSNLSALAVSFFGFALRICARRIWTALPYAAPPYISLDNSTEVLRGSCNFSCRS
jgi:hypothetical protein